MITIQNIYYMLSYAYKVLQEKGRKNFDCENFKNTTDLLSAILIKGVSIEVKRGLGKEYTLFSEPLTTLRGKIDINQSIKEQAWLKKKLFCHYDELSINHKRNQIIKSCLLLLFKSAISPLRKQEIRKLLPYFLDIDTIELKTIDWNMRFHRNTINYQMLMGICELIVSEQLQKDGYGKLKIQSFVDTQSMCRLYEKFILEYYKKHKREYEKDDIFIHISSPQINWLASGAPLNLLPIMQSDIVISKQDKSSSLVIDAKYYAKSMSGRIFCDSQRQEFTSKKTLHSNNLYQIFTYVKNAQTKQSEAISGMLLYAKTDEEISPVAQYNMSGNTIFVRTLDLNQNFEAIKKQLNTLVYDWYYLTSYK